MGNSYYGILYMIAILGLFYLILIIPENKRRKKYNSMLSNLKVNDEIVTKGGVIGRIVTINDGSVVIQTGPDRVRIKVDKNGISGMMNADTKKADKKDDKKEEKKPEKKSDKKEENCEIDVEQK